MERLNRDRNDLLVLSAAAPFSSGFYPTNVRLIDLDRSAEASRDAIITVETAARAADSAFAPNLFPAPLPEGAEVSVLENRSPWMRVRLANRRDVWVKESSLAPVRPEGFAS